MPSSAQRFVAWDDDKNKPALGGASLELDQVLAGNGYTVSTQVMTVPSGQAFSAELINPAGSGVNLVMTSRVFSANMPLRYQRYPSNSTVPAGGTTVAIGNRISGRPAFPGTFRFIASGTPPTGTPSSQGFVPANYLEKRIKEEVLIAPGNSLVYNVGGAGGGLLGTEAQIAMTFLFYTRPA